MKRVIFISTVILGILTHAGCDITSPPPASAVVQMFVESDSLLAPLMLHETFQPSTTTALPITNAEVSVRLDNAPIAYHHNPANPGMYEPREPLRVYAGSSVDVSINYDSRSITASTILPPKLEIDSVLVVSTDTPIRAVYSTDDDFEPIDGFVYLIDIIVYWTDPDDDSWWIRAYLDPPPGAPISAEGLILRMDETRSEEELTDVENSEVRRWQGTYAFPADGPDGPLESHQLNLAVLRSGLDYARFALYQQNPEQGMAGGNVTGGVGIVAGISTDRRRIIVEP